MTNRPPGSIRSFRTASIGLIRRLQDRYRVTSVVVTHDMKSAFHVGDHIAYLHEGRIYFYGTPAEIQASTDPIIQDFLIGRATDC